ncbi:MAG: FAD-dependent oxidoreductase [Deltaproteobacteria bacterium]|nr:FAD-dependent oxidoreductase [Deltaproteobacteria bacterium]
MKKRLVLVGGGHAHMVTLGNIHQLVAAGFDVTVIGPSEYHYYSGMGPGMLSRIYTPDEIRFATRKVVVQQGGAFIENIVTRIEPETNQVHLLDGKTISYDVLSCNAGSYVPWTTAMDTPPDVFHAKPIERLLSAQQRIIELSGHRSVEVAVVGGGAAAVELVGNAWRLLQGTRARDHRVHLFARSKILERFPEKVRQACRRSLSRRGIRIHENRPVDSLKTGELVTRDGERFVVDIVFLAVGVRPSPIFETSGLPIGPDGGLRVNRFLQSTAHPDIFGGGDCIYFADQPLEKVGVYAVRQNPVLFHNLKAALTGKPLMPFIPGGDFLLILNMGDGTGVFFKKGLLLSGRLAFRIKDYIDRRFMKKFQVYEMALP